MTLPPDWQPVHNARVRHSTPWPSVAERFEPDARVIAVYGGFRWAAAPYVDMAPEIHSSARDAALAADDALLDGPR